MTNRKWFWELDCLSLCDLKYLNHGYSVPVLGTDSRSSICFHMNSNALNVMSLLVICMCCDWIGVRAQVRKKKKRRDLHWIRTIWATGLSDPTGRPQENCQPGEYISLLNHCLVARQLDKTAMSSLIVCMIKCTTETWRVFEKIKSVFAVTPHWLSMSGLYHR